MIVICGFYFTRVDVVIDNGLEHFNKLRHRVYNSAVKSALFRCNLVAGTCLNN